jgi:hypothetical protein
MRRRPLDAARTLTVREDGYEALATLVRLSLTIV